MQVPNMLQFFAKYIESELGIIYAEHNYFQLQNRLEEIAKLMGVSLEKLSEQAQSGIHGTLKQLLLDIAANNETSFFRDPRIFQAIENVILKSNPQNLRIWSAASSTGQEALSMAILIREYNLKNAGNIKFSILGSDISERVLERAKSATYTQLEVQRGLPMPLMIRYFSKDNEDRWTATAELSRMIEYKKINLKDNFSFTEKFDLVLCRNVLIYQNVEGKKDILGRVTAAMGAGGYLILGAGESLLGLSDAFEQISENGSILYRKK